MVDSPAENIPDVQNRIDDRHVPIHRVGIKDVLHPVTLQTKDNGSQQTAAKVSMYVSLPPNRKGTHMSRFMQLLNEQEVVVNYKNISQLAEKMVALVEAHDGYLEFNLPLFVKKSAPASGVQSYMDYNLQYKANVVGDAITIERILTIPVTTLCPCSRDISEFGAHNQRSHITIAYTGRPEISEQQIIELAEQRASCELYGILKRPDEKEVTERAYKNPKFVEDLVRDVSLALDNAGVDSYIVEVENFESIHNHSAYARIERNPVVVA